MNNSNLALQNHKPMSYKYYTGRVRVAFYCRVSTQHESQIGALENQIQWCDSILRDHPNWEKVEIFYDKGISGTQAKKRDGFMRMIRSVENGNIHLIVTREVSRFARNTVDSLQYTRYLAKLGVEVFFYNDNIWSLENDAELRLTIMSAMSQNESGHISERVLSGQAISRENGILYGNGNILGYRLVRGLTSADNTYEIIEEDAETVRLIYQYYLKGMGAKAVASKMVELHRKNASGKYTWDATQILRVLGNKTYCGYVAYNKSYTTNFLEHTRKNIRDKSQHRYVKGNFPAIISEETYEEVQRMRESKVVCFDGKKRGHPQTQDRWKKVLVCQCGHCFKRYKWRVNSSTGESCYGYRCYNIINKGSKDYHAKYEDEKELSEYCNMPSICEWKLNFQLQHILMRIWENPQNTIQSVIQSIEDNYVEDIAVKESNQEKYIREKKRIINRLSNLLDLRLDGKIEDNEYEKKQLQLNSRLAEIENQLNIEQISDNDIEAQKDGMQNTLEEVKEFLNKFDLDTKKMSDELVASIVSRVTPMEDGTFKWYLGGEIVQNSFNENDYVLYDKFVLDFETARAYRKKYGNFIRHTQYKDIKVEVYLKFKNID